MEINSEILKQELTEAQLRAEKRVLDHVANGTDYGNARHLAGVAIGLELAVNLIVEAEKRNA
jgi:hypothetical protein